MGNRASISFKNGNEESVVLFSHWGGTEFQEAAEIYVNTLIEELNKEPFEVMGTPLARLEPQTVMVDFIRHLTKYMDRVTHDLHLGKDEADGDNSDCGHVVINLP